MARFRCRFCGEEGTFIFEMRDCPNCGSVDVQLAIGVEKLPDDDPRVEAMMRLADDEKTED
jgi:hypothetical protein